MWKAEPVTLSDEERRVLSARVASQTASVRDVRRAQVILLAADGVSSARISVMVPMSEEYVALWRRRFLGARLEGLGDAPRSGRPRRLGHDEHIAIAAAATSAKDPSDPVPTWTYWELAAKLAAEGIAVSVSRLWSILRQMDIDLTRVRGWLNRRADPEFWDRVRAVCGLYLNPPAESCLVLSVDEKTAIGARERRCADQMPRSGRARRSEFEYVRHGHASIVAALDVFSGEVLAKPIESNNSVTFCEFLDDIDRVVPKDKRIVLILDNGSSHVSKATRAWLEARPRFEVFYTPVHASWVNQVELFFSILTRRVLRRGSFTSRQDLIDKMMRFIADYDDNARPFAWTYAAQPLKVA
jgi:transposase